MPFSAGAAVLSLSDTTAAKGDTITVTLSVSKAPNTVNAFMLEVTYDFTTLSTRGVYAGTLTEGRYSLFSASNIRPGVVRIGGVEAESPGITEGSSGSLAHLTFEVIGTQSTTLKIAGLKDDMKKAGWSCKSGLLTITKKQEEEEPSTEDNPSSDNSGNTDQGSDGKTDIDDEGQTDNGNGSIDNGDMSDADDDDVHRWSGGGFIFPSAGGGEADGSEDVDNLNIVEAPEAGEEGAGLLDSVRDRLGSAPGRKDPAESLLSRFQGGAGKQTRQEEGGSVLGKINLQSKSLFSQKEPVKNSRLATNRYSQDNEAGASGGLSQQISRLQKQQQRVETILWLQLACLGMQVIILLILLILLVKKMKTREDG